MDRGTDCVVSSLVLRLAQPSLSLAKQNVDAMYNLCEMLKHWLMRRCLHFVSLRSEQPILLLYGSDCRLTQTRAIFTQQWLDMITRRAGKATAEYLIQKMFLLDAALSSCAHLGEPLKLYNKTAFTHMQAMLDFFPSPRTFGHSSIFMGFFMWDRAVQRPLEMLTKQY